MVKIATLSHSHRRRRKQFTERSTTMVPRPRYPMGKFRDASTRITRSARVAFLDERESVVPNVSSHVFDKSPARRKIALQRFSASPSGSYVFYKLTFFTYRGSYMYVYVHKLRFIFHLSVLSMCFNSITALVLKYQK